MLNKRAVLGAIGLLGALAQPAFAANLIQNSTFAKGVDPWWKTPLELKLGFGTGEMCLGIAGGSAEIWDVIVGQNDIAVKAGTNYRLTFKARATPDGTVRALVQMPKPPWTPYGALDQLVGEKQATYSVDFVATETRKDAQVAFQVGGSKVDWKLCLDDVSLTAQ